MSRCDASDHGIEETDGGDSKRRHAIEQLGGPNAEQMYFDAELGQPVILAEKDGWGLSKREYMERTWWVSHPRCWIADHGCEIETITQRVKLQRMKTDRYQPLTDESFEAVLDRAAEKNGEWVAVNMPHIPYEGEGGVNVYVDEERLRSKRVKAEDKIVASDHPFEPTIKVKVAYGDTPKSLTIIQDGESIPYEREHTPESLEEGVPFVPEGDRDGETVELRLNTECEECGETEYDVEVER